MQAQYASAQNERDAMKAAYEKQLNEALALNKTLAECLKLEYALERSRKTVEELENEIKRLEVTGGVGATNVTILQRAAMPEEPIRPNTIRVAATAIGLA